jgi:uncharacterized protein (UPF0276 family)
MSSRSNFPLLIADLSDPLLELMALDDSIIDGVEVGPWFSIEQISAYRQKLPDLPFIFHGTDLIVEVGENSGVEDRIKKYLACTDSPWISVHLVVWETGVQERLRNGERLPLPDPEQALAQLVRRLEILVNLVPVPVLVENIEPLPFNGYDFWSQPEYISRVLERSGCGLLLDTGHMRISAERLGMNLETYLGKLPLERVVEIHVSGPRRRGGRLLDGHESLQPVDFRLLESLLSSLTPQAVTLEYIRDKGTLSWQLKQLRRMPGLKNLQSESNVR